MTLKRFLVLINDTRQMEVYGWVKSLEGGGRVFVRVLNRSLGITS
jgi:hypothetical protein